MKRSVVWMVPLLLVLCAPAFADEPQAVQWDKIPSKGFKRAKGYEEALELQKEIGADILLYFARLERNEKGLCRWFENKGLKHGDVQKFIKNYIYVYVQLPSNKQDEELAKSFNIGLSPSVYVVKPDSRFPQKVPVFEWDQNKNPKLRSPEEIIESIRSRSSPAYSGLKP